MNTSDLPEVNLVSTFGGGNFNLGYVLYNERRTLLFPTLGIGGNTYRVEVTNEGSSMISFGDRPIAPSTEEEFELPLAYLDINLNYHRLLDFGDDDDEGGISFGMAIGYQVALSNNDWRVVESKEQVQGVNSSQINTFYIRLFIGGGGFEF